MKLVATLRSKRLQPLIDRAALAYSSTTDTPERHAVMLERLNRVWKTATLHTPRYRELVAAGDAPDQFDSIEQFASSVPPLTKAHVRADIHQLCDERRPADKQYTTGGSTGEPSSFPGWQSELPVDVTNRWLGRSFYGITPADRLFLIWGHHHLLGKGWKAKVKGIVRAAKSRLVGYARYSAYDLAPSRCDDAARMLLGHKPDYVVGYSSALDLLARLEGGFGEQFRALRLKGVIATAEMYPTTDSPSIIESTFGCPAIMEYGAVETGVTAYTHPEGGFRVFWRDHLFELGEQTAAGGRVLRITSLYERKTPLFRYEIGDEVVAADGEPNLGPARIKSVLGRVNSVISLPNGTAIHSVAATHSIKDRKDVAQFQLIDCPRGLALRVVATSAEAQPAIVAHVRENLTKLSPMLKDTPIEFVDRLPKTKAGKTQLIVKEDAP